MNEKNEPRHHEITPQNRPIAKEVFFANGINIDINPHELVITFDRVVPGTEPEARTVLLNANSIYQLQNAINSLVEVHNDSLKKLEDTGRYGQPPNN